jgi:hypothetical protein
VWASIAMHADTGMRSDDVSKYSTTTVGPTRQSWLDPRPRIDTTWTVNRSADGSIAIVRQWHFRSGDGSDAEDAEQRAIDPKSSASPRVTSIRPASGVGSSALHDSTRGHRH